MRSVFLLAGAVVALAGCPSSSTQPPPGNSDMAVTMGPVDLAGGGGGPRDLKPGPLLEDMAPAVTVVITDDKYTPQEVTISVGQKVRWSFQAAGVHGVNPWDMAFPASPVMRQGIFEFIFTVPGTYDYGCAIHGTQMPGRVVVRP
jgi:plastocyanin